MGKKILKNLTRAAVLPMSIGAELGADAATVVADPVAKAVGKLTGSAVSGIAPAPPIEVPAQIEQPAAAVEDDTEDQVAAAKVVRRRASRKKQTRTLLDTSLGGGQATVGRPTLLGG
ncbi:MAG: hypothetical protein ACR2QF_11910 [Geminicoccaceae bacterium]